MPGWAAEQSLLGRAVALLREVAGVKEGVRVDIKKVVPLMSGLGGDSSDAAALLKGLNEFRGLGLSRDELAALAARLGSDVVFFLDGGTASVSGRGEAVTPLTPLPETWVVLAVPDIAVAPGKTARMYQALKPSHFTDGAITKKLVENIRKGEFDVLEFNTFENVADIIYPGLRVYKEHLLKLGAPHVHLAGAGPALFTIFRDEDRAGELFRRCRDQGLNVYLTTTI
jgi:4-diphosphocytidyl-2-C-methyl-D-erythritol kinase